MTFPAEKPDSDLIPETPKVAEETWKAFTIAFAIFALIAVFLAFGYVFLVDLPPSEASAYAAPRRAHRASAVTPFLAACAAAVTFCAVMWRGSINSRQADEQRRQNDSTEEAELALLLDKAVGVLKSKEPADIQLALAMLGTIALAANDKYATFALDLVIDTIVRAFPTPEKPSNREILQITSILSTADSQLGRKGSPGTKLDFSEQVADSIYSIERYVALLLGALPRCDIKGISTMLGSNTLKILEGRKEAIIFQNCEFSGWNPAFARKEKSGFKIDDNFIDCTFRDFFVPQVATDPFSTCLFIKCDFSGAEFSDTCAVTTNNFEKCYYDPDDPPYVLVSDDGKKRRIPVFAVPRRSEGFDLRPAGSGDQNNAPNDDESPF